MNANATNCPRPWYEMVHWRVVVVVTLRLKFYRWLGLRSCALQMLQRMLDELDDDAFLHPTSTAVVLCCIAHEIAAAWAKDAGLPDLRGLP